MKYVLVEDWVTSRHDGERHKICAPQLARLYGLNLKDCKVVKFHDNANHQNYEIRFWQQKGYTPLFPDWTGKYELPIEKNNSSEEKGREK